MKLFVIIAALCCSSVSARVSTLNLTSFFEGKWTILRTGHGVSDVEPWAWQLSAIDGGEAGADVALLTGFSQRNVSTAHGADTDDSDEDESLETQSLHVALDSLDSGTFRCGADEDSLHTVMEFSFAPIAGYWISGGQWRGDLLAIAHAKGTYSMQIASSQAFTLTITPENGDPEGVVVLAGRKVLEEEPKTFFQRYKTIFMVVVVFTLNIGMRFFARRKFQAPSGGSAPTAFSAADPATSSASDPTAGSTSSTDGAGESKKAK